MIRFGLLGGGRIGKIHGGNVAASGAARLVAVADAMPEAAKSLAEATGASVRSVADQSRGASAAPTIAAPTNRIAPFKTRNRPRIFRSPHPGVIMCEGSPVRNRRARRKPDRGRY